MNRSTALLYALVALVVAQPVLAEMDVDQADSLNFEGFHTDKKAAVKAWRDQPEAPSSETVKTYERPATAGRAPSNEATDALGTAAVGAAGAGREPATPRPGHKPGQRYEIRERYSLERSASTPYSAFYVIEPLHREMARLCPAGWAKLNERSEPVEQDFYLYYEFECL